MSDLTTIPAVPIVSGPDEAGASESVGRLLARVGQYLEGRRHVSGRRGLLAALRRVRAGECDVPPEEFWELVYRFEIAPRDEPFWLRVLPLMATHRHDPGKAPGASLAAAGVKPGRLERWLRSTHDEAWDELPRLLARLDGVDWSALGVLMRSWSPELRRRLARSYFRSPEYRRSLSDRGD